MLTITHTQRSSTIEANKELSNCISSVKGTKDVGMGLQVRKRLLE